MATSQEWRDYFAQNARSLLEIPWHLGAELTTEDVMRIWDALDPAYRISVSYVARVVRLDPDQDTGPLPPVVAARFAYGEEANK